ncbi:MAG: Glu/Leu/Phe/Val dehydrogenase [Rhodospirillaceae bacterium]|nr:Glu/Leu/Phe/Val dehydrogenase [Rhodospirillaceae bacterium]
MTVFDHPAFDAHEHVVFHNDAANGLKAIIAIHNTARGPAVGGCRMWPYADELEGLTDALRLSRGMSYKSALANLPFGGGKSVIFGDPKTDKSEGLWRAMGRFVESLGGRYVIAEDVGTSPADMEIVRRETAHVSGIAEGGSGDPSPATAWAVYVGIKAAVRSRLGREDLKGLKVAVQGLGHVGYELCQLLARDGAILCVADINRAQIDRAIGELGATAVDPDKVYDLDTDVFAPCALGAVINDATIPRLKAAIVAGSANNQLAEARHADALRVANILYAPDYAINAGGIINIAHEGPAYDKERAFAQVSKIHDTLLEIFALSEAEDVSTATAANRIALQRLQATVGQAA